VTPPVMDLEANIELLKALAHPVRLAILNTLVGRELSVGAIEEASGIAQPGLSQQLAVLRNAALVHTRRETKLIFYRINQERIADLSALIDAFAGTVAVRREDAEEVSRLRGGGGAAMFARMG